MENITADSASLRWKPPEDDGGSPITNYTVEMKQPHETQWSTVSAGVTVAMPEFTVTSLKPETDYIFRVTAENKAGKGKPSEPSDVAKYGK